MNSFVNINQNYLNDNAHNTWTVWTLMWCNLTQFLIIWLNFSAEKIITAVRNVFLYSSLRHFQYQSWLNLKIKIYICFNHKKDFIYFLLYTKIDLLWQNWNITYVMLFVEKQIKYQSNFFFESFINHVNRDEDWVRGFPNSTQKSTWRREGRG